MNQISDISKIDMTKHTARVALAMDYSGSMDWLFDNGSVQKTVSRLLPIALRFDDRGTFVAYIPSIIRGKNILKKMNETNTPYSDPHIYDSEVEFKFKTADMDAVANLLKASSFGADITPYSLKNFPKADITIPTDKMDEYKKIIALVQKEDLLTFSRFTQSFLSDVLAKKLGRRNKPFDYKSDMKKLMMARQTKEYIYTKNMWDEYLKYLEEKIKDLYKEKEK